ncbi:MAG: nuclear transport factor 2 family protein [Saprospiraceae bacterium]|nr:nuclear transport factor 2 family protein [Saprospiraceae bacterium]MCB9344179.1 nuclear transport factor 2 family protein [Lewinellaceae bacterium]
MTNLIKSFALIVAFTFAAQMNAQTTAWVDAKSASSEAKEVHNFIHKSFTAFTAGDDDTAWAAYSENAAEVDPTGSITYGLPALKESWDAFMKMTDEKPSFTFGNVKVRMLTKDVALFSFDTEADIKMGGQQLGGKSQGVGVVKKSNGQWKIELDAMVPVMQMPEGQ